MAAWTCTGCGGENPEGMRFCGHCGAPAVDAEPRESEVADALRSFVAGPVAERLIEAGGHIPEERRLVTALFADVSGFTSLADRLDPEELLEVIDPVISALSSVVGRHEGYVEKFAGDALMALFGAPVSHEDDAARAVRVAVEMHTELARIVSDLPHEAELTLHVGINSGHGIARILGSEARMDYAVLGDAVILAQRLESAAPPGETYVSESTVLLTEAEFEYEPVGELTLKGKSEAVPAWRVIGERRARPGTSPALIGRRRELTTIVDRLDRLAEGRGSVIVLTGEPGVGKSRLTAAVANEAESREIQWLDARCISYGAGLAYWPYADLLRRWSDGDLAGALDRIGVPESLPYLGRLLGVANTTPELEPEAFRRALHEAFAAWLGALCVERPVVLVVEDVHWIDSSSLELTRELAALTANVSAILYLVARDRLAEIAPNSIEIGLEPLGADGVAELIEAVLGSIPPAELASFIARRTAGNPLFVRELLRSLLDSGTIERTDGRWQMRPGWDARALPATLEEVLSARIDVLQRPVASLLQTCAVIGRRVPLALLGAVAGEARGSVDPAIDDLVARGFLERHDGAVSFHHALIQDAAYERLLRRKRQQLHRRVAEAAEELYGAGDDTVDLLARHLYLGGGGPKAVAYLRRAGERSTRLFANDEAILHLSRAVELAPADPDIRLALADLHELVGSYDAALQLYEAVSRETSDVRAWRGVVSVLRKRGAYAEALERAEQAFRAEPLREQDLTPLWLEQGWTLLSAGRFEHAIDVQQAGLEAAHGRRDTIVGELLLGLVRAESIEGRLDDALEHVLKAKTIFEEREDLRRQSTALRVLGDVYIKLERFDDAVVTLRAGVELAERTGSIEEIGGCLINLGLAELQRGNLSDAIECDRRAIDAFERIAHGAGRATAYANLAEKLLQAGETRDALEYCNRALELAHEIGNAFTVADATHTRAAIQLEHGESREAGETAEQAASLFVEMGAMPAAMRSLELAAEAWKQAGETTRARDVSTRARALT